MNTYPIRALLVAAAVTQAPLTVQAQREPALEYAVKLVCGSADRLAVAPGSYYTAINVHNPAADSIRLRYKVASTLPNREPGGVSQFAETRLGPDQAFEIDCEDATRLARARGFLKGFVVIQGDDPVDVVAVYTVAGEAQQVEALYMERVRARQRAQLGCSDLVVDAIRHPEWDGANGRTVIEATIRNVGTAPAPPTHARVIDPTTTQSSGAAYNAVVATPALQPDHAVTITFYLPYWVYNPDVTLEVTADYKNEAAECREDNNLKVFADAG